MSGTLWRPNVCQNFVFYRALLSCHHASPHILIIPHTWVLGRGGGGPGKCDGFVMARIIAVTMHWLLHINTCLLIGYTYLVGIAHSLLYIGLLTMEQPFLYLICGTMQVSPHLINVSFIIVRLQSPALWALNHQAPNSCVAPMFSTNPPLYV